METDANNPARDNFTFEHLILQGAPHTRTNGVYEAGYYTPYIPDGYGYYAASLLTVGGPWSGSANTVARGITIQNCVFKNARYGLGIFHAEDVVIRSNTFLYYTDDSPNGDPVGVPSVNAILNDNPRDPLFQPSDLIHLRSLVVGRLNASSSIPVDVWLWNQLSSATRIAQTNYLNNSSSTDTNFDWVLRCNLVQNLNAIITSGSSIYASNLFPDFSFPETRALVFASPATTNLIQLNRMLLEDAYNQDIASTAGVTLSAGWGYSDRHALAHTCVGIITQYTTNLVVTDNSFNGCVRNVSSWAVLTNFCQTDGFLYCINGLANCFVARNSITNYWLEGNSLSAGGPAAVVGNYFTTLPFTASTRALHVDTPWDVWKTNLDLPALTFSFVANCVFGGRSAVDTFSSLQTTSNPPTKLHICGNRVQVNAPWEAIDTPWDLASGGGVAYVGNCSGLNVAGNSFGGLGSACQAYFGGGIAEIINNDFCGAPTLPPWTNSAKLYEFSDPTHTFTADGCRFHDIISLQSGVRGVLIAGNQLRLSPGGSHLTVYNTNSPATYFLMRNSYYETNQTTLTLPLILPSTRATNLQQTNNALPPFMPAGVSVYLQN